MKSILLLPFILIMALTVRVSAQQELDPVSKMHQEKRLKSDVVGSYPKHIAEYIWDEEWVDFATVDITYKSDGQPATIERTDTEGKIKSTLTYNQIGQQTEDLFQSYVDGSWVNLSKEVTTWEDLYLPAGFYSYSWDGGQWVLEDGTLYNYDYEGERISVVVVSVYSPESDWSEGLRYTYEYTGGNDQPWRVVMEVYEEGVWVKMSRTAYIYENGLLMVSEMEGWENGNWNLSAKIEFDYGENDSSVMTTFNWIDGEWVTGMRFTEEYDAHGNLILDQLETYGMEWILLTGTQYVLTYDGNNLVERITKSFYLFGPEVKASGDMWENEYREVFSNFASLSVDHLGVDMADMLVFPNPSSDKVSVRLTGLESGSYKITLTNLLGEQVYSNEMRVDNGARIHVPIHDLPAGMYFVNLLSEQKMLISKKLMVSKK